MFGIFESLVQLAEDTVDIIAAPVEMAVDLVGAAVKPVAEVARELVEDVKSLKDDL
jgi:hypothetical protein